MSAAVIAVDGGASKTHLGLLARDGALLELVRGPESSPQNLGLERALGVLDRLFELTRHDERRGFTLEVRVSNEGAIHLYEALGFEARGVRRGYYTDNREDALIMWKDSRNSG